MLVWWFTMSEFDLLAISSGGAPAVAAESILDSTTHSTTGETSATVLTQVQCSRKSLPAIQADIISVHSSISHQPSLLTGY
jgi:hypothetical protein